MVIQYQPLPLPHHMPNQWPDQPAAVEMSVPADVRDLLLSRRARAHLLVLPRARPAMYGDASKPTYDKGDIVAVEQLVRQGVSIAALHDPDERDEVAQLSAEVVVALGVFVAQALAEHEITAMYQHVKAVIGRVRAMVHERGYAGTPVLSVDVFEMRTVGGAEVRAQRISGPAESTAEFLLEALREANRPAAESSGSAMQGE